MTNTNEITVTVEKINELRMLHDASEKRLERAEEKGSKYTEVYRSECLAYERVLDLLGIDW